MIMSKGVRIFRQIWSTHNLHLSRITAYLEVKSFSCYNMVTKYCGKEKKLVLNFSSFQQYFEYTSNFMSKMTYLFVNCVVRLFLSSILQT